MDRVLSNARCCDFGSVRDTSMGYLVKYKADRQDPIPQGSRDKSIRGFTRLTTARMLCPYQLLNKFDEDPEK